MERFQFFETFMDGSSMYLVIELSMCDRTSCSYIFFCICVPFDVYLSVKASPQRKPASAETSRESFRRQEHQKRDIIKSLYTDISYVVNSSCTKVANNSGNQS
jgi:hypothetical protein